MSEDPQRNDSSATAEQAPEGAGDARSAPAADEVARLKSELEAARAEAADYQDRFLRARAEVENVRRRAEIDLANAHKYGIERFAAELLAVRDSLELARTVDIDQESPTALAKMHEGLDLTLRQMDDVFRKFGLAMIDPKGERFDPEKHHAISVVETGEVPANHVVSVMQKGCLLNDRVLRPAMVVVARAPGGAESAPQA
jgi:molecular chaperone GrpE